MNKIYETYVRRFEERFDEELAEKKVGEYDCLKILREISAEMERRGESPEERHRMMDRLASEMTSYVDRRTSIEAKRVYELWHGKMPIDRNEFETAREELLFFDRCYRNVHEELERFETLEGAQVLSPEAVARVRDDLVRFEQLIQTYIRLLELRVPSEGETGA